MADKTPENPPDDQRGATATQAPPKADPKKKPPQPLPPWKVLLHNDDHNDFEYVIVTMSLTTLNQEDAVTRTLEAHKSGVALLLTTHKERAELYRDQFGSKGLTVTIEPAE